MTKTNRRQLLKMIGATTTAGLGLSAVNRAESRFDEFGWYRRLTFVLIHGAWQNGSAWDGVAELLRRSGHEVDVPTLPGAHPGDTRFGLEFADYADAVVDTLRPHRHAIVVAHSSAGMLLQAGAPRVARAIEQIVFCNAFIVANGQSQLDNVPVDAAAGLTALAGQNDGVVPFAPLEGFVRGALMEGDPVARQDALIQRLVDQPFSLFSTAVDTRRFEALAIRKTVLICARDHSADYLGMAARLGHYETVVANGSHEMLFAAPREFVKALLTLVG